MSIFFKRYATLATRGMVAACGLGILMIAISRSTHFAPHPSKHLTFTAHEPSKGTPFSHSSPVTFEKYRDLETEVANLRIKKDILEASVNRGRTELEALKLKVVNYQQIEANLQREITFLRLTERPPIDIPQTPQDYGRAQGRLLRKKIELLRKFPEVAQFPFTPEPGTQRYREFVESYDTFIQDAVSLGASPLKQELQKKNSFPDVRKQLAAIEAETLIEALSIPPIQAPKIKVICEEHQEYTYQAHGQVPAPYQAPLSRIRPLLATDQQTLFDEMNARQLFTHSNTLFE